MGTEAQQAIDRLAMDALGPQAAIWQPELREIGANETPIGPAETQGIIADFLNNRVLLSAKACIFCRVEN